MKLYHPKEQEWIVNCVGCSKKKSRFNHGFQRLAVDPKTGKLRGAQKIEPYMQKHQKANSKV